VHIHEKQLTLDSSHTAWRFSVKRFKLGGVVVDIEIAGPKDDDSLVNTFPGDAFGKTRSSRLVIYTVSSKVGMGESV